MDNVLEEQISEEEIYKEFEKALIEAIAIYEVSKNVHFPQLDIFIGNKVWNSLERYERMDITTKEKFFESLLQKKPLEEYTEEIKNLWNIDHSYMDREIKELEKMVIQRDFKNYEMYKNKKITVRSIKLQHTWQEYQMTKQKLYPLHPEKDFKIIEDRFVNRHIKLYKNLLNRVEKSDDVARTLTDFMKKYDQLDKTIPYFSHSTGEIIRYVDVGTYNSMLYNVNLTRSGWNRTFYDAILLGDNLFLLDAHPFSCPMCAEFQGYLFALNKPSIEDEMLLRRYGKPGSYMIENAIDGGVGHPNCKHQWLPFTDKSQIQAEKYNSSEWEEKYKTKQKIQSLDLKKSRLLADRRIYNNLGQQDLVDKTTSKIKRIREQKKELEKKL